MNAEDVAIGMEIEARESMDPEARWLPAVVRRRLDADAGGSVRGLFEVQMTHGHAGPVARWVGELRRVQAVAGALGGSAAVLAAPGGVAVEVRGASAIDGVRALLDVGQADRMARLLRAGAAFKISCLGGRPDASVWADPTDYGLPLEHSEHRPRGLILRASAGGWRPSPGVLLWPIDASMLAGLIESAAADARSRAAGPPGSSADPDWGKKVIADALRRRDGSILGVLAGLPQTPPVEDGFVELPPGLHADPLAGARRRTDENLRRAFGG